MDMVISAFFVSCRYVRAEVLAGFVNGLFLIFTAFFIFSEGVEVCYEVNCTINCPISVVEHTKRG